MSDGWVGVLVSPGLAFEDVVFEQVDCGCFVVFDRLACRFLTNADGAWTSFCRGDIRFLPLKRVPWLQVHLPRDYGDEEQLFNEVRGFFIEHLDVADDLLYDVYACFVLASWRLEDFNVVPYLFFLGPLASGKTRALECFHRLCFRAVMASSMSAASLFRALEAWHPTLLLDETEVYSRKEMIEVLALLNSGYRRGQYAIRVEKVKGGAPQIAMFDTFGFKVLAGTEELAASLQSRCIVTKMSKAVKPVRLFIDEEKAQTLRDKLLMYRFKNLGKNGGKTICSFEDFPNARVLELFISLLTVAPSNSVRQRLMDYMAETVQNRLNEEQASMEARVFDAILKCEDKVENGRLSTQTVTEAFNESLPEKEKVSSRLIGRVIARLGFEKCKISRGGLAGFYWNTKLVERLKTRYGLDSTPETPLSPPTQTQAMPTNGENGENRVCLKNLKAIYWSDSFYEWHQCVFCGQTKLTSWQAEDFKGEKHWICENCKQDWEKLMEN
ncbi:MAG: hypothetical protein N0A00_02470 [Candidatus Bathyarchaeota archaeon]|nr:hypothetical protein [Candidatus Bathyarchaeota archaeon]